MGRLKTRLIDAEVLKERIITPRANGKDLITELIDSMPTVDSEPHWIPCSEALPENSDTVLITHRGGVSVGWYNGRYWERGASTKHRELTTVVAWMPLPKPYEVKE